MVEHSVTDLDAVFHALANETRRSILTQLRRADATVTELADPHQMSFAAVSKHLGVLAGAGLLEVTPEGRYRRYHIVREPLGDIAEVIEFYRTFWEDRIDGLEAYLASQRTPS